MKPVPVIYGSSIEPDLKIHIFNLLIISVDVSQSNCMHWRNISWIICTRVHVWGVFIVSLAVFCCETFFSTWKFNHFGVFTFYNQITTGRIALFYQIWIYCCLKYYLLNVLQCESWWRFQAVFLTNYCMIVHYFNKHKLHMEQGIMYIFGVGYYKSSL